MRRGKNFFPVFFVTFLLAIAILVISLSGNLPVKATFLEKIISSVQKLSYMFFQNLPFISRDSYTKELERENIRLVAQLSNLKRLEKENIQLRSQLKIASSKSYKLLLANIVSAPGFIPGVTIPSYLILDKGAKDGINVGNTVIFEDNLVGQVTKTSSYVSKVSIVTNPSSSFTVRTQNGSLGVVKGGGGDKMTLQNVLPTEDIKNNEIVLTKGDVDLDARGIVPNLVVGKIQSIEKIPSAIFQKAKVKSLINFSNLTIVFVIIQAQ